MSGNNGHVQAFAGSNVEDGNRVRRPNVQDRQDTSDAFEDDPAADVEAELGEASTASGYSRREHEGESITGEVPEVGDNSMRDDHRLPRDCTVGVTSGLEAEVVRLVIVTTPKDGRRFCRKHESRRWKGKSRHRAREHSADTRVRRR